ncbi:MAG: hypothetical protein IJ232_00755 [Lachnospiraceae bacterium]|nr:hypothetical protein [Lachnospiraceae bacterium]
MKRKTTQIRNRITSVALSLATAILLLPIGMKNVKAEEITVPLTVEIFDEETGGFKEVPNMSGTFTTSNSSVDKCEFDFELLTLTPPEGYDVVVNCFVLPMNSSEDSYVAATGTLIIPVPDGYTGTDATILYAGAGFTDGGISLPLPQPREIVLQ